MLPKFLLTLLRVPRIVFKWGHILKIAFNARMVWAITANKTVSESFWSRIYHKIIKAISEIIWKRKKLKLNGRMCKNQFYINRKQTFLNCRVSMSVPQVNIYCALLTCVHYTQKLAKLFANLHLRISNQLTHCPRVEEGSRMQVDGSDGGGSLRYYLWLTANGPAYDENLASLFKDDNFNYICSNN